MSCGAANDANSLIVELTEDVDFTFPEINLDDDKFKIPWDEALYEPPAKITTEELTTRTVGGDGVFDALMQSFGVHLRDEYDKNRITGQEYTKAYIALTEAAMGNAVQFLLQKDQAFWQAQLVQAQAITAKVALEQAKVELVRMELQARMQRAEYALTKLRLSTEDINYCIAQYNLENILPEQLLASTGQRALVTSQKEMVDAQKAGQLVQNSTLSYNLSEILPQEKLQLVAQTNLTSAQEDDVQATVSLKAHELTTMRPLQMSDLTADTSIKTYNLSTMLPAQKLLLDSQTAGQDLQNDIADYNLNTTLVEQTLVTVAQKELLEEQREVQRAQTQETRSDGLPVAGTLGAQKNLHMQQIDSYKRDAEIKLAKIYSDAWTVQKTIDEGLTPPSNFTNILIDAIFDDVKGNINIG